jgi:hypothetical protein
MLVVLMSVGLRYNVSTKPQVIADDPEIANLEALHPRFRSRRGDKKDTHNLMLYGKSGADI